MIFQLSIIHGILFQLIIYKCMVILNLLSKREKEVFLLIVKGSSTKDIANQLSLKSNTISSIKSNAFKKLNIKTLIEAYELFYNTK